MVGAIRRGGFLVAILLAVLIVALFSLVQHLRRPPTVSLGMIHRYTRHYEGDRVQVSGVVRVFNDSGGRYYVLQDAQENRVLLRADPHKLAGLLGSHVTATGVIGFDPHSGIYLDVEAITGSG